MLSDGEPIQDVGFLLFSKSVSHKVDGIYITYNRSSVMVFQLFWPRTKLPLN